MTATCALFVFALLFPQDSGAKAAPLPKTAESADWPKLASGKQDELLAKLTLFKRASPERVKEIAKEIQGYGKGAVPLLLAPLQKAEPEWKARLLATLDALTDATDAARLLQSANSKTPAIRQYAIRRASLFAKAEHAPVFVKALEDTDLENRFYAALGASRAGALEGISPLFELAGARWDTQKSEILAALNGVRGAAATGKIRALFEKKEDESAILALRLLAGAGDASAVPGIAAYLDSTDNRFKEEAINALRGIVDRAPPLENVSAFDLIDLAKQWKDKLKTWKPS